MGDWPRLRDRLAAGVFATLVVTSTVAVTWTWRHAYTVSRLKRGVGDTWFLGADG